MEKANCPVKPIVNLRATDNMKPMPTVRANKEMKPITTLRAIIVMKPRVIMRLYERVSTSLGYLVNNIKGIRAGVKCVPFFSST